MKRRLRDRDRSGLTLADVAVVLALIVVVGLLLLMGVSRTREQARLVGCRKNLAQIGMALALYDQMEGHLPEIGPLAPPEGAADPQSPSPLKILLETLQLPDLNEIRDRNTRPEGRPGQVPGEIRVRGFVCASDPNAMEAAFPAPISYRAVTGDNLRGDHGAFSPGPALSFAAIEARDGLSYTAAFSERLVGDNQAVARRTDQLPGSSPLPCPRTDALKPPIPACGAATPVPRGSGPDTARPSIITPCPPMVILPASPSMDAPHSWEPRAGMSVA